jgi:hypothetical protein
MPARELISDECRDPVVLSRTIRAFEDSWSIIADGFSHDPALAERVRLRLAKIILNSPAMEFQKSSQNTSAFLHILTFGFPSHADTIRHALSSKVDAV